MQPIIFHLLLDRIKVTINLLRKSDIFRNHGTEESQLLGKFKDLQSSFRCGNGDHSTITAFITLLCDILSAPNLAGPYKLSSLESMQTIVINRIISGLSGKEALISQIVDCIVGCKFVQTDVAGDQLVQLHLLKTIQCLVVHEFGSMSGKAQWSVLQLCLTVMESLGGGGMKKSLVRYRAAEEIVVFVTESILNSECFLTDSMEASEQQHESEQRCLSSLISLLKHISSTLAKGCERWEDKSQATAFTKESQSMKGSNNSVSSANGGAALGSNSPFLLDINLDSTAMHIVFCLKTLQCIMIGISKSKVLYAEFFRSVELRALLGDIGFSLLTLGRWFDALPGSVFQCVLSVYVAIFNALGSQQKPFVEHFFKQVYIRGLGYTLNLLSDMMGKEFPLNDFLSGSPRSSPGGSPPPESSGRIFVNQACRVDYLELVLESLCDLIADDTFLPTLFATFDCAVRQIDLVQPCLQILSRSASIVVTAGLEKLGPAKELGVLVVQCFKQVLTTLSQRKAREDAWRELKKKAAPSAVLDVDTAIAVFHYSRQCKNLMAEASVKFSVKPSDALKFLQHHGLLASPTTPAAVANFLRFSPLLSKQAVGSFLGELGKQDAKSEWDTPRFHEELLVKYVESFELNGKSVLDCMRIFLSAFRLPGEAQQIDRILVAFSEYCHKNCLEGQEGLLENPEVTYLLSFSIIMLNTDRHNPNIRPDRKMTAEQFVRNNTNYGKEVNQTKPIPKEFLETIYSSIAERQIRTEADDPWAVATDEEWMDLQMQCNASRWASSLLFVPTSFVDAAHSASKDADGVVAKLRDLSATELHEYVASQLFATKWGLSAVSESVLSSRSLEDAIWLWDRDMLACCADLLFLPCIAVHIYNHRLVKLVLSSDHLAGQQESVDAIQVSGWKERTGRLISLSGEFTTELLTLSTKHNISRFVEQVILLLQEVSGMHQSGLIEFYTSVLCTDNYLSSPFHSVAKGPMWKVVAGQFSEQIAFASTQKSLLFLLEIIATYSSAVHSWEGVLYSLSVLRDHILLPSEMVLDSDGDLLPPNVRVEFDALLTRLDRTLDGMSDQKETEVKKPTSQRGSFLSLHMLGEALFGSTEDSAGGELREVADEEKEMLSMLVGRYSKRSSRWDAGYDQAALSTSPKTLQGLDSTSSHQSKRLVWDESLRTSVTKSNICSLITESKFLPETALQALMRSIARATECYTLPEGSADAQLVVDYENLPPMESLLADELVAGNRRGMPAAITGFGSMLNELVPSDKLCRSVSASSMAWLEVVLVEISLRNRDRFHVCWLILRSHYLRSLGSSSFRLSYVAERQMSGLLKLVARMLSRDHYAGTMIELLGKALAPVIRASELPSDSYSAPSASGPMTATKEGLTALSNQITAGMWRILTQNVDLLPLLSLEQWETLFRIIAFGSSSGSYAAFKSFEVMAWLLHEPRLIANVPVFCIIAVKPLVRNKDAPTFVSIGAVRLLKYLHSRLEALFQDSPTEDGENDHSYDSVETDDDAAVVWKKCWLPILQCLADGVSDSRLEVRDACASALCDTVRDRHAAVVPTGILINVLVHILIPVIRVLGDSAAVDGGKKVAVQSSSVKQPVETAATSSSWERDGWASTDTSSSSEQQSSVVLCINTLAAVFLQHIKKLAAYPSFDKLWLQVLSVLSHFIGAKPGAEGEAAVSIDRAQGSGSAQASSDQTAYLEYLSSTALEQLRILLSAMQAESVLQSRQGLLAITREHIQEVRDGDSLLQFV